MNSAIGVSNQDFWAVAGLRRNTTTNVTTKLSMTPENAVSASCCCAAMIK